MNVCICANGSASDVRSFLERLKTLGSEYVRAVTSVRPQVHTDYPSKEITVYLIIEEE